MQALVSEGLPLYAVIAEQCLAKWPASEPADAIPGSSQAAAGQNTVCKHDRDVIAKQQDFAHVCVYAGCQIEHRAFI